MMWRLGFLVVIAAFAVGACGDDSVDIEGLRERLRTLRSGTFTVAYVVETIEKAETTVSDAVWYHDGTDDFPPGLDRLDTSGDRGLRIRIVAPTSYLCRPVEGETRCSVDSCCRPTNFDATFVTPVLEGSGVSVVGSSSETIAGLVAQCYKLEFDLPLARVEYSALEMCVSEEGLLLSARAGPFQYPPVVGMVVNLTAVAASTDVEDDVFERPYPLPD